MRKRITALLLASIMTFSFGTASITAEYADSNTLTYEQIESINMSSTENQPNKEYEELKNTFKAYCSANNLPENSESLKLFESELYEISPMAEITKASIRNQFELAALACGVAGYPMIEETLSHACQDNPSSLLWKAGTEFSNEIKSSSAYATLMNQVRIRLQNSGNNREYITGSIAINSPTDIKLSLHNVNYTVSAKKSNDTWKVYIGFSDIYDFDEVEQYSKETNVSELVVAVNNYAAYAMNIGALNEYKITAYMQEAF